MQRISVLLLALAFVGCQLPQEPLPDAVVQVQTDTQRKVEQLAQEVALLRTDLARVSDQAAQLVPWAERIARLEVHVGSLLTPPPKKGAKKGSAPPAQTPAQVIQVAAKEALVQPTARGYFGSSNTYRYRWQPQRTFLVYLRPGEWCKLTFPAGDLVIPSLALTKDFEGSVIKTGGDAVPQSVVLLRALADSGQADTPFLTESGRSYDVRLVIGTTHMFAVTFEAQSAVELTDDTPSLRKVAP